jgi:hypothetical protein
MRDDSSIERPPASLGQACAARPAPVPPAPPCGIATGIVVVIAAFGRLFRPLLVVGLVMGWKERLLATAQVV